MLREIEGGGATDSVLQNTPVLATQDSGSKEGGEATESAATGGGGGGDGEEGGGSTVMTQAQKKAAKKEREKNKKEAARQAKLAQQSKQERTANTSEDSGATAEEKTMATADKDTMDDEQVRNNEYCIARNIGRNYLGPKVVLLLYCIFLRDQSLAFPVQNCHVYVRTKFYQIFIW